MGHTDSPSACAKQRGFTRGAVVSSPLHGIGIVEGYNGGKVDNPQVRVRFESSKNPDKTFAKFAHVNSLHLHSSMEEAKESHKSMSQLNKKMRDLALQTGPKTEGDSSYDSSDDSSYNPSDSSESDDYSSFEEDDEEVPTEEESDEEMSDQSSTPKEYTLPLLQHPKEAPLPKPAILSPSQGKEPKQSIFKTPQTGESPTQSKRLKKKSEKENFSTNNYFQTPPSVSSTVRKRSTQIRDSPYSAPQSPLSPSSPVLSSDHSAIENHPAESPVIKSSPMKKKKKRVVEETKSQSSSTGSHWVFLVFSFLCLFIIFMVCTMPSLDLTPK